MVIPWSSLGANCRSGGSFVRSLYGQTKAARGLAGIDEHIDPDDIDDFTKTLSHFKEHYSLVEALAVPAMPLIAHVVPRINSSGTDSKESKRFS